MPFILSLLLALQSAAAFAQVDFIKGDFNLALTRAKQEDKVMMIFFFTDWCGWCKMMDKNIFSERNFSAFSKSLINLRINAERGNGRTISRKLKVQGFPTVVFLTPAGKELNRINGYFEPALFLNMSKNIVNAYSYQRNAPH